jgi:hypothetical protein
VDYKGNICGVDGKVKNFDKKWEPDIMSEFGICVKNCPDDGEIRVDVYTGDEYKADIKVRIIYCVLFSTFRCCDLFCDCRLLMWWATAYLCWSRDKRI